MNVANLEEKWGKYCNINQLVSKVCELYSENHHGYTTHGICVMLDEYFTQKAPMIDLFMTSNHYIGDMRIAIKKDFERQPTSGEIRKFFYDIHEKLDSIKILEYVDENGKTLYDNLMFGKKQLTLQELPNIDAQQAKMASINKFNINNGATLVSTNRLNYFRDYMSYFQDIYYSKLQYDISSIGDGPSLTAGTKTSRAFNAVCCHYGVDKFNPTEVPVNDENGNPVSTKTVYPYNKVFAAYSDLVSNLTRKMHFVISLNPLDYLTMSNGISWKSCHNIYDGCYKGGTLSYMLDSTSMITFVVDKLGENVHQTPKYYRQMFHYKDGLFLQNRLYPQGNDGATDLYEKFRNFVIEEFSELLDTEENWEVEFGTKTCEAHTENIGIHYKDYLHNSSCNVFYQHKNSNSVRDVVMRIGHEGICSKCGKQHTSGGRLTHERYDDNCRIEVEV